ncbi:MAG: hypothetical protein ABIK36_06365 [Pseudomonadota bacterium]
MQYRLFAVLGALAALSGCIAASPNSIEPQTVSTLEYESADCARLALEDARVASELGPHIWYQRNQRSADIAGIAVWGLSPSGMGMREHSHAIARLKGEREAISNVKAVKGCTEPQAAIDGSKPREQRLREIEEEKQSQPGAVR